MENNTRAHNALIEHVNAQLTKTTKIDCFVIMQNGEIICTYKAAGERHKFTLTCLDLNIITPEMKLSAFMNAVEWCIDLLANQLGRNLLGLST